jgi:hypothetical protein
MLGTQQHTVAAGRNFVEVRADRKLEDAPQVGPRGGRRPFLKRP